MDYVYSGNLINYRLRFLIYLVGKDSPSSCRISDLFLKKRKVASRYINQHHQKLS